MALAHKGLEAEIIPCRFTDKDKIAFSGQERVPVLRDGDNAVSDSWRIACYLEDTYPDRPSLFGGEIGRGEAHFINAWMDRSVHARLIRLVVKDIYDHVQPEDRDYFRASREKRFGATLEDIQGARDDERGGFIAALGPLKAILRDQPYICGSSPAYADYIVFGGFQWSRSISPYAIIDVDDPVYDWRGRMLDLFDGLARSTTAYPV